MIAKQYRKFRQFSNRNPKVDKPLVQALHPGFLKRLRWLSVQLWGIRLRDFVPSTFEKNKEIIRVISGKAIKRIGIEN